MKIIITAGGTEESIDKVRKITNMSTGNLGSIIGNVFLDNIKDEDTIFYICNKKSIIPKQHKNLKIIFCTDTNSVLNAIKKLMKQHKIDAFIHSMAISDYTPTGVYNSSMEKLDTSSKLSSNNDEIYIKLKKTPKILDLIKGFGNPKLVSFKLLNNVEESFLETIGLKQLTRSNSDLVVANDLTNIRKGNHSALMISKNKTTKIKGKENIAKFIVDFIM